MTAGPAGQLHMEFSGLEGYFATGTSWVTGIASTTAASRVCDADRA